MIDEITRIALGQYLDDFELGKKMSEAFGIKTKDDGPEEKFGDDRLGVNSLFGNIGITVVLIILVLFVLTIIVYFTNRCIKRSKFSQKSKERIKLLQEKIFFNPLIRITLLNTLQWN